MEDVLKGIVSLCAAVIWLAVASVVVVGSAVAIRWILAQAGP